MKFPQFPTLSLQPLRQWLQTHNLTVDSTTAAQALPWLGTYAIALAVAMSILGGALWASLSPFDNLIDIIAGGGLVSSIVATGMLLADKAANRESGAWVCRLIWLAAVSAIALAGTAAVWLLAFLALTVTSAVAALIAMLAWLWELTLHSSLLIAVVALVWLFVVLKKQQSRPTAGN